MGDGQLTVFRRYRAAAGLALVADDMVAVLLGPKWLPVVTVLRLLCIYSAVRAVEFLLPPVLFARLQQRFLFWCYLALLVLVPAVTALGAVWGGAAGAVVFFTPVYCGLMAIMTKEALAELKGSFSELWSETWPILAATATMAVLVLLLREFALAAVPDPPLVELVLLSVSGAASYGIALLTVGTPVIREGIEVAGWILGRYRADRT
jgi:O-antigen/teichoic acid export membrane protein